MAFGVPSALTIPAGMFSVPVIAAGFAVALVVGFVPFALALGPLASAALAGSFGLACALEDSP